MSKTTYLAFVQSAPGLEPLLHREMESLLGGRIRAAEQPGGVTARLERRQLFQLCLASRFAESVRIRLKSFIARDFSTLEQGLGRLPWAAYLPAGTQVDYRVVCHRSRLWHTGAVIERVSALLARRFAVHPGQAEEGAIRIHLRITGDAVQASVDAGGYRLHRRGIRQFSMEASVRETIAAATVAQVLHGQLGPQPVIWDPFCGAGTLGLEALMMGGGILPGSYRSFAFEGWPTHDEQEFEETKGELSARFSAAAPYPGLRAFLSDQSALALEAAEKNLKSAGLLERAQLFRGSVSEAVASVPQGALVATNPPYGKRLKEAGAMDELLDVLQSRPDLRPVALLVGGSARKKVPARFRVQLRTRSGGENVSVRILERGQFPR